jgi:hypothetical protein
MRPWLPSHGMALQGADGVTHVGASMRPWLRSHGRAAVPDERAGRLRASMGSRPLSRGKSHRFSRCRASPSFGNEAAASLPRKMCRGTVNHLVVLASMRPWLHSHGRRSEGLPLTADRDVASMEPWLCSHGMFARSRDWSRPASSFNETVASQPRNATS